MKIKDMSASERPREKMWLYGKESLSNSEIISIIVKNGYKQQSALAIAQEILSLDTDGIAGLSSITLEELEAVAGIGKAKATEIIAAVELGRRVFSAEHRRAGRIRSVSDVAAYFMNEMRHLKKEYFNAVLLNSAGDIIGIECISMGNLNSSPVHPRETFKQAIKKSAASILLVHNHPSGEPEPSNEDIYITERLVEAGNILGIKVVDHVIIGNGCYVSMKEKNII